MTGAPRLSSRYSAAYRAAGRRQLTSVCIALRCSRRHTSGCRHTDKARRIAAVEHLGLHRREVEAGADAGGERHLVGVDHRVAQPADMRDDRQRAVAQGAELRQAARLEARRHQQRVAAALDQMRQRLVVADLRADIVRVGGGGGTQTRFQRRARRSRARQAARRRQAASGSAASSRSIPFCADSRLITPNSSFAGSRRRPNRSCSAALFAARRAGRSASNVAARYGSCAGFHTVVSMPLRMPDSTSARVAQQAVEPHAARRRADLRRIGRRYRGDPVGELQPGLQVADRAVVLDALDGEAPPPAGRATPAGRPETAPGRRDCAPSSRSAARSRRRSADRPARARPASHARAPRPADSRRPGLARAAPRRATARRSGTRCPASPVRPGPRYGSPSRA